MVKTMGFPVKIFPYCKPIHWNTVNLANIADKMINSSANYPTQDIPYVEVAKIHNVALQ